MVRSFSHKLEFYLSSILFIYYNKCEGGCLKRAPLTNNYEIRKFIITSNIENIS